MRCTNLIELASIALDETTNESWLQAMPLGDYHHPVHGHIKFTPDVLNKYAEGVNQRIRTTDLDIDYDHKQYHGEASGWVKQAEVREDGLWLLVEWTKTAAQKIREKAYKYFSPEFIEKWTHPKTKVQHKYVLMGGAITNRPFLKDIATLNLTEKQSEELMLEELRKELGLPDDADEATVIAAVRERNALAQGNEAPEATPGTVTPIASTQPGTPAVGSSTAQVPVAASETTPSDDPIVKLQEERIAKLELALRLSEVDKQVARLNDNSRPFAIAPVMLNEVRGLMVDAPTMQFSEKLFNLFERICKDGLIELGERGGRASDETNASPTKQFSDLVAAKQADNPKMGIGEVMELVAMENPAAWAAHREATTLYGGVS